MLAKVKILVEGYVSSGPLHEGSYGKTCPTVSLVKDGDIVMVVDPGTIKNREILIEKLKEEKLSLEDINYVCITHSHLDHYKNVGMFPNAKVLEYFGVWSGDSVEDWREKFTENIQVFKTPGHDRTSITLFIKTDDGVVAICGDVFWKKDYPEFDLYAEDQRALEKSRELVASMSHWIIPGHGAMFKTEHGHRFSKIKQGKPVELKAEGRCRKCKKPFKKPSDHCLCQEWLCYRCCECERDCGVCNCKVRTMK